MEEVEHPREYIRASERFAGSVVVSVKSPCDAYRILLTAVAYADHSNSYDESAALILSNGVAGITFYCPSR